MTNPTQPTGDHIGCSAVKKVGPVRISWTRLHLADGTTAEAYVGINGAQVDPSEAVSLADVFERCGPGLGVEIAEALYSAARGELR